MRAPKGAWAALASGLAIIGISVLASLVVVSVARAQDGRGTIVLKPLGPDQETRRFALVIGNSTYKYVSSLRNATSDAASVAAKLQGIGYEVHYARDLDRRGMNEAVATFLAQIEPGSETLVYYSGHGVELNGSNYLLPVDIPSLSLEQERLLRTEGVNLTELLMDLESRSARVTLVILDACRDNPFRTATSGTRSLGSTRGLGRVDPPRGTFVIFAAGVGEQALDNLGPTDKEPNGLFTRKLLSLIDQEGLEIRTLVQRLRVDVRQAALSHNGHSQTPSYYDQLLGEFYLRPKNGLPDVVEQTACGLLVTANASKDAVMAGDSQVGLRACIGAVTDHPNNTRLVELLKAAQEQHAMRVAVESKDRRLSDAYLTLYPSGRYMDEVRQHLASIDPAPLMETVTPIPAKPDFAVGTEEVAKLLQTELKRIGCDPGLPDGIWGRGSVRAIELFNQHANTQLETKLATLDAIKIIREKTGRICPLTCGQLERVRGDQCVRIVCSAGFFLSDQGTCERKKEQLDPVCRAEPRPRPRPTSRCYTVGNSRFCE